MSLPTLPNGKKAAGHLSLADASGDSAIFEYLGGKLIIHHNRKYTVMTNSPTFDQQLAIDAYWKGINGLNFQPGTISSADRFVPHELELERGSEGKRPATCGGDCLLVDPRYIGSAGPS